MRLASLPTLRARLPSSMEICLPLLSSVLKVLIFLGDLCLSAACVWARM